MFALPKGFKNPVRLLNELKTRPEQYWVKRGEARALKLFHLMARRVPAYKDFLKKNKVNSDKVKTIKDFKQIPPVDKDNYLRVYSLESLCWDGKFANARWTISTTSGSTGEPFYFPRQRAQDWQYATLAELYLRTNFQIHRRSTLYINGFPMGAWIGGVFTYDAIKMLATRGGYKLSIISPGIHKDELIKAVRKFGHKFDQLLIASYGPFLKDTLDDAERAGLNWNEYNLGFIFSAEGFTEEFRDYVINKTGVKNSLTGTLNHYGTVDLGTMSYETPISILARRTALKNKKIYRQLFGDVYKLPTFTQYIPELFYFEDVESNLFCSAFSGLPLVRYDLKDHGGVLSFSDVSKFFADCGVDLLAEAREKDIERTVWRIPYVHVYERSDFSVSFYAFNIYPETVRRALQDKKLSNTITGKFTMLVKFDKRQNQYFEVNIELKAEKREARQLAELARDLIIKQLLEESSEYRETYGKIPAKATPKIVFWPYEHPRYFKPGIKQKWVEK